MPRDNLEYRYTYHRNILIFKKFNKLAVPENVKERVSMLWGLFQKLIFIGQLFHRIDYNICTFFFFFLTIEKNQRLASCSDFAWCLGPVGICEFALWPLARAGGKSREEFNSAFSQNTC